MNAPRGADWADILEVLHALVNTMTVRAHYAEGHPAIQRADAFATQGFTRVLDRLPELVVALIDNEFVVCERPMPDLRARLHVLADAMLRHEIECLVFQRGMSPTEASFLGRMLVRPPDQPGKVREQTQAGLQHILLRFAELTHDQQWSRAGKHGTSFAPVVAELLASIVRSISTEKPLEKKAVTSIATEIVEAVESHMFSLESRCWSGQDLAEAARHASNVALVASAIALAHGVPKGVATDVAAAALLHDIGHLLLPPDIRCIPEPLLDEKSKPLFRNHTFAGASTLLSAGCPPLWVAAALEHHRGIDGGGYPVLESKSPPHELVRMIALANFFDRRRTILPGKAADDPDEAIRRAVALEDRYFGKPLVGAFLRGLGVFPPGTTVLLSTREVALVTHANPTDPWRPQVRLVTGSSAGKRVDLKEASAIEGRHYASVVRAVPPPLLRPDEAAMAAPDRAAKKKDEDASIGEATPTPTDAAIIARTPSFGVPAVSGHDRARQELADMGGVLDALLTIKTDDLSHAPGRPMSTSFLPSAPTAPPRPPSASSMAAVRAHSMPMAQPAPPKISLPPVSAPPPRITAPPVTSAPPPRIPAPPADGYAPPKPARSVPVPPISAPPPRVTGAPQRPASPSRAPAFAAPPPNASVPKASVPAASVPPPARATAANRAEAAYLRRLGSLQSVPRLVRPLQDLALDPRSGFIASFVDGASTIEDIIDVSGAPRTEVLRVLDDLVAQRGAAVD